MMQLNSVEGNEVQKTVVHTVLTKESPLPSNGILKPLLKWVGGKGQLVSELIRLVPNNFGSYHEPFAGGAALFFALYRQGLLKGKHSVLSDSNKELIDTYKSIRDDVESVIRQLQTFHYDRDQYYEMRAQNPAKLAPYERAARMIYLNRTCFNGLYRVNRKGEFNVPFGRFTNPTICDSDNLRAASVAFKDAQLSCQPFSSVLDSAKKNDFIYFDPPYVPLSKTANFVSYASNGFSLSDQEELAEVFCKLNELGVKVMQSNSDTDWVNTHYRKFKRLPVQARRNVNSRADRRGSIQELIIINY
jgi:DNA adenine methylase